jgi:hypothetical protein
VSEWSANRTFRFGRDSRDPPGTMGRTRETLPQADLPGLMGIPFQNGTMKSANISQHLKLLQPGTTKGSRAVISCSYPNCYAFQPPSTVRFSPLMNADSG